VSASPSPSSEPETTPEEYRQRAMLLADLGRYDEAAGDLAAGLSAAPDDAALLATLARVHLAADQPAPALLAAERAVAAAPDTINPLVVRAMALTDSRRYGDAATVAHGILRRWPEDPYAQRTGAALLSESRNGQAALNAAWHGVRIAPDDAEAHLVLAVVAARLRLFDLAQRAYSEALDLDTAIAEAQADVGIVRLERRRWARALEALADEAALGGDSVEAEPPGDYPSPFPRPYRMPDADDTAGVDGPDEDTGPPRRRASDRNRRPASPPPVPAPVDRPQGPVLDPSGASRPAIRQAVLYGANATLVASALTGGMTLASGGAARVWAGLIGVIILAAVLIWLGRHLPEPIAAALARDRRSAVAAYATFVAPVGLIVFAAVGGPVPLVAGMVLAAAAELLILIRRGDGATGESRSDPR
jgi:Flp pilus assembly protein TadD